MLHYNARTRILHYSAGLSQQSIYRLDHLFIEQASSVPIGSLMIFFVMHHNLHWCSLCDESSLKKVLGLRSTLCQFNNPYHERKKFPA